MGEEFETYILKKLDDAITESASTEFHFAARFFLPKLHKEFTDLKELIERKRIKIKQAAAAAAAAASKNESTTGPSSAPARPPDAGDGKKTGAPTDAGDKKDTGAPLDAGTDNKDTGTTPLDDNKDTGAPLDACGDNKDTYTPSDDKEEDKGAPWDAGGDKDTGTTPLDDNKDTDAPLDASDKKDTGAPSQAGDKKDTDVVAGDKSKSGATPDVVVAGDKKEIDAPLGDKKENAASSGATSEEKETGASLGDSNTVVTEEDLRKELREQLYYLNNVLTEWQTITEKPFSCSPDSLSSMKDLSKTLKKIKQDLKEKPEDSSHSGILIPPTATPEVVEFRWSTRLVNLEKVHGFEDKILSLERLLVLRRKDTDAFKAFGIHGMAGVGKTTLCQSIFSRPRVSEHFFPRIWVCLSKQRGEDEDNKKEVVKRMLRCLGIDDEIINKLDEKQEGIRRLLFALRLQLTGKRYFIVLDDAHNADEWFKMADSDTENDKAKFSYGLPKECGGTVIVTSRVEQVVKNMVGDEENLRCIEPLTDEDTCWKIFKDTVEEDGTQFPEDLNKPELKIQIVKRCDGLPLAAKLLGQIKHKELRENPHPPTLAVIQRAEVEAGNQQAAVEAAK